MKSLVPVLKKGEFPHARGVVQVVDDAAIQSVLSQDIPQEGLLFDFDHYSDLANDERTMLSQKGIQLPSDASGWIHGFTLADDGNSVFAEVDWTEAGEKAVKGGSYKYTSPVFPIASCQYLGGNRVRPTRISKVALTNEPNMKAIGAILANREALANSGAQDGIMAGEVYELALSEDSNTKPKQETEEMKEKLARALGLAIDASEDAIMQSVFALQTAKADGERKAEEVAKALSDLKNRVETAEKEAKELREAKEKAELDAQVAAELAKYPNLPNRESAEAMLRANFDAGKAFLDAVKDHWAKPAAPANASASGKGMTPGDLANRGGGGETPQQRLERVRKASFSELKK